MEWDKIKEQIIQKDVPKNGYILAYTREQVIFRKYDSLEELDSVFLKDGNEKENQKEKESILKDILEIHLFNQQKEYRAIASTSKRDILEKKLCAIEHIADFNREKKEEVYEEKIQLEPAFIKKENGIEKNSITILNHISYNEYGMASVDDYRLVMEG